MTDTIAGNEIYTRSTIQKAVDEGLSLAAAGKTTGNHNYPRAYNLGDDFDSLGACKKGMSRIYEFPVERGTVYSGGAVDQLVERVVFQVKGKKGVYCGMMTQKVRLSMLEKGLVQVQPQSR